MEAACIRYSEIPHTSSLFLDFQYHFDRVKSYYQHAPGDPASYKAAAAQIDYPSERRAALVAALRARNAGSAALERLAKPGTVAVVTGQQVGLFSGPAYSIYKALTAVRLANRLSEHGVVAVPVFWLATEDHDFAEVNHVQVFSSDHRAHKLATSDGSAEPQPVGTIRLAKPPLEKLREALSGFPYGEEAYELAAGAYQTGATYGEAFEHLLRKLLAKWDLIYLDPLDTAIREIAAPLMAEALLSANELKAGLLGRNKELQSAGYHAQVHVEPKTSLFFLLENGRREALRQQNGDYFSKDHRYSVDQLAGNPARLSPNALLRPVVQDFLLPTVAYVGGPGELAYLAQSQVIYKRLLKRMPVVTARTGFTILDGRAHKLLERYRLNLPSLFHGEGKLKERIGEELAPKELKAQFQSLEESARSGLGQVRKNLLAFDPTLAAASAKTEAKILYQISKLARKMERQAVRREQRAEEDIAFLLELVYPEKRLQERVYSILPFIAKHGTQLLDVLYDAVHLECPDHKALVI